MLQSLYIQNIALIEKLEIEFGRGLNCLTGETGAGKSVIIDSIGFVLGARSSILSGQERKAVRKSVHFIRAVTVYRRNFLSLV